MGARIPKMTILTSARDDARRPLELMFSASYSMRSHAMEPREAARCAYCGRYGPLGRCEGCGAPNAPDPQFTLE